MQSAGNRWILCMGGFITRCIYKSGDAYVKDVQAVHAGRPYQVLCHALHEELYACMSLRTGVSDINKTNSNVALCWHDRCRTLDLTAATAAQLHALVTACGKIRLCKAGQRLSCPSSFSNCLYSAFTWTLCLYSAAVAASLSSLGVPHVSARITACTRSQHSGCCL